MSDEAILDDTMIRLAEDRNALFERHERVKRELLAADSDQARRYFAVELTSIARRIDAIEDALDRLRDLSAVTRATGS